MTKLAPFKLFKPKLSLLILCGYFSTAVNADGFADLAAALNSLEETSQVSGKVTLSLDETRGDKGDDDYEQHSGYINSTINYGSNGLSISYDADVMSELEREFELKAEDEEAKTPTMRGLNDLRPRDITALISQSQRLAKLLKGATQLSEKTVVFNGKEMRELAFDLPLESIMTQPKSRKYVDKFSSDYRIVIDNNGFPISSTMTYSGKGRAYLVLSFAASGKRKDEYKVIGNRLVSISSHDVSTYDSTFGNGSNESQRFFDVSQETANQLD